MLNFALSIFSASQMFVSKCSDKERVRKTDLSGANAVYGISMSARCVSTVASEAISWWSFSAASFPTVSLVLRNSPMESAPSIAPVSVSHQSASELPFWSWFEWSFMICMSAVNPFSLRYVFAVVACLSATFLSSRNVHTDIPLICFCFPNVSARNGNSSLLGSILIVTSPIPLG